MQRGFDDGVLAWWNEHSLFASWNCSRSELWFVLCFGIKHGIGNCIAFNQIEEFYPEGVKTFKKMLDKHEIQLPKNICSNLSDDQMNKMTEVALNLEPLWENALGKNWRETINTKKIRKIYEKM